MSETIITSEVENTSATSEATQAPAKAKAKRSNTSKAREAKKAKRRKSAMLVKLKSKSARHIVTRHDKKGAETYTTGAAPTSRTAKINAVLFEATRPMTCAEIQEKLDSLYGADEVKALRAHLATLLAKGAVVQKEKRWALVKERTRVTTSNAKRVKSSTSDTSDESNTSDE
jgi:hypothetical protein